MFITKMLVIMLINMVIQDYADLYADGLFLLFSFAAGCTRCSRRTKKLSATEKEQKSVEIQMLHCYIYMYT